MEEKTLLMLQFLVEILRLWIGMKYLFGARFKRIWLVGGASFFLFTIINFFDNDIWIFSVVMWVLVFLLYMAIIRVPDNYDWKWKIGCGFVLIYQEEFVCMIMNAIPSYSDLLTEFQREVANSIFSLITTILIAFLIKRVKEYNRVEEVFLGLKKSIIPLVIVVVCEMMVVIVLMNTLIEMWGSESQKSKGTIINILSMLGIGILFAVVIYIKKTNDKVERLLIEEQRMKAIQLQHYERLLEKEEATRKYRHDINGHLAYLENRLKENDIDGAQVYIKDMCEHMQQIRNISFDTGNKVLDALLGYHIPSLSENVDVKVMGKCKTPIIIEDMAACTIFSNLIKNAVEAIQNVISSPRFLFVEVYSGERFAKIVIKNSYESHNINRDENGIFETTKEDKKNHGFGMLNVKEAIDISGGKLLVNVDEKVFCSTVFLPVEHK